MNRLGGGLAAVVLGASIIMAVSPAVAQNGHDATSQDLPQVQEKARHLSQSECLAVISMVENATC